MANIFGKPPPPPKLTEPKVTRMPVRDDPERLANIRQIMEARRGRASTRMALAEPKKTNKLGSGPTGVT
jgi:hypothetical protein